MRTFILTIVMVLLSASLVAGEEPRLEMSAPNAVSVGDQFRLTLSLNARGDNLRLPDLTGFDILMGPSTSQSTSIQIINGRTTQTQSFSYTYILRAREQGTYTLRPASVEVDGRVIQSNSITVQVVPAGTAQPGPPAPQGGASGEGAAASISADELFVRLELSKRSVYKNEQIIATVKLYASPNLPLTGFEEVNLPTYEGFYTQEIDIPQQVNFNREVYNDKIYQVGILKKTVLFPQQTGNITVQPFSMTTLVQQRVRQRNFFDDFFSGIQNNRVRLTSEPVTINVRDLPPAPASFYGGVGNFSVGAEISSDKVTTNDAVTLKFQISGSGNLRLIQSPKWELSSDFEQYDPRSVDNIRVTDAGMNGSRTVEYLFQPRLAGKYTIPGITFTFFNPATGSYDTRTTRDFVVEVTPGSDDRMAGSTVRTIRRQDVQLIGQDIRHIWVKPQKLYLASAPLYGSTRFYLGYAISTLVLLVVVAVYRKRLKESANLALMKNRKASSAARKHLKLAARHLKSNQEALFYESVLKAFWGYLSDKLTLPLATLKRETAVEALRQRQVDGELIDDFLKVVDQCEYARYAPAGSNQAMQEVYETAAKVIDRMERKIRK